MYISMYPTAGMYIFMHIHSSIRCIEYTGGTFRSGILQLQNPSEKYTNKVNTPSIKRGDRYTTSILGVS